MAKVWKSPAITFCKEVLKNLPVEDEKTLIELLKKWKPMLGKMPRSLHGMASRILDFEAKCLTAIDKSGKKEEFLKMLEKIGTGKAMPLKGYSLYYQHVFRVLKKYE